MPAPTIPTPDRTSLVRGPSLNTLSNGTTAVKFYAKEDFNINVALETMDIMTSPHGKVDERIIGATAEATITPEGRWTTAFLGDFSGAATPGVPAAPGIYAGFTNIIRGTSLLNWAASAADATFVASGSDGEVHTLISAAITKLPDIFLSAKKTALGSMTVKGYRGKGMGFATASSLYTTGTGGSVTDSTFTVASIPTQPYVGVWGSVTGFTALDTVDGWTISFNLSTKEIEVDSQGKIDVVFDKPEVMAKCQPVGPTSANILAAIALQNGIVRGASLQARSHDLVITGADGATVVTVKDAALKTAGYQFGADKLRVGEVGFVATRLFTAGVQGPLFTLAAAA